MFDWYHASRWSSSMMRINCCVLLMMTFIIYTTQDAQAETVVLQHDTVADGAGAAVMTGFQTGDVAASLFTLPPGVEAMKITSVDAVMAVDPAYGALETVCDLQLYCSGSMDTPSAMKEGGMFNPGLNSMDVSSDGWIVRSDFAIGLRYRWAVGDIDHKSTHVVTDVDGCQAGVNLVYDAAADEWIDPCTHGIPGDFAIRVTGEPILSKAPFGDFNADGWFVDMIDFAAFQRCMTLPAGTTTSAECLAAFDCDRDSRVDTNDLSQFITCARGPGIPLDPACGACLPEGTCPAGAPLKIELGHTSQRTFAWVYVIIGAIILIVLGGIYFNYLSPAQVIASRNAWMATYRCPYSTTDQLRLKEAMIYLRDTAGATDPDAYHIGKYMMDNKWYECGSILIAEGPNPDNIYASSQGGYGGYLIFIDRRFVEWQYFKEVLAMILYGQMGHFMDPAGNEVLNADDRALNLRLDGYRFLHGAQNYLPEYRHGAREGVVDDAD